MNAHWAVGASWALAFVAGCYSPPVEPLDPTWADVAPILRGECDSCHGWTAPETGSGYRLDFFDVTMDVCGHAAYALDNGLLLAGSGLAVANIKKDVVPQGGAAWARMPPLPSPKLPSWERDTIERWTNKPEKGLAPTSNRPPTLELSNYPDKANQSLGFTAVLEDPDGDSALGVIEANGLAFLMNRPGSFAVHFDSSSWPAGSVPVTAVVCDGWVNATYQLDAVQISHDGH
ncbi:MAG: hypothetical protein ABUL67_00580 [Haliangium ochraceum]